MRGLRSSLVAAVMLLGAVPALAADADAPEVDDTPADTYEKMGFYLRGDLGWSFLEWGGGADDNAFAVGGGAGYRFNDNLRADLRLDWAGSYDVGGGNDLAVTTVLGNMYFDWANSSVFTPYVGAGLGYGWATFDGPASDGDGVAYALQAGVGIDLTENVVLDAGYRFRDVMISGSDPMEHQFLLGARFGF
jgi:opacity protein-like surface antigen